MSAKEPEVISIPFKQIGIPEGFNYRHELPKIKELAASMKERGQIQPWLVTNGGPEDKPYDLIGGARRHAAWELNGWQNKDVLVRIMEYKKGDFLSKYADSWADNEEHVETSPLDQAELFHKLIKGHTLPNGEEAPPVERDEIIKRFNISKNALGRYLKMYESLTPDIAREAKKADVPVRLLFSMSSIEGSGKTKEEKLESRTTIQDKMLNEYVDTRAKLEEEGRQRGVRSDKGKSKKKGKKGRAAAAEHAGVIKATKRIDDEGRSTKDYLKVLRAKLANGGSKEDKLHIEGAIETCRFFSGDLKKFPYLVAGDFEILNPEPASDKAEE